MKTALTLATLLLAALGSVRAATVELSGFACLFQEKMALLVVYPSPPAAPVNFTLSEGQEQNGIKLLQVDSANHRVEIEQDGVRKIISLSGTSILDGNLAGQPGTDPAGSAVDPKALAAYLAGNEETERIKAGNPIWKGAGGGAGTGSGQNGGNANNSGGSAGSTGAADASDHTKEYWYVESVILEQTRIDTAQEVADGTAEALPRTPFTPDITPPQLIGKETFFGNHIPGFIVPGYVDPLVSANPSGYIPPAASN